MKPLIVYDGECRFCQWSVRRIERLDDSDTFDFAPRQLDGLEERFPRLARSDFNTGMRLLTAPEEVHVGADAVYQIYRRIPPFHLVAWLYRVPVLHALCRLGYALIARYRYLSGKADCESGACSVSYGARNASGPGAGPS